MSAVTPLQAGQVMRGRREPDVAALRARLGGHRPPPLVLIQGDLDAVVAYDNAVAAARLWLDLLPDGSEPREQTEELRRGQRRPVVRSDWKLAGQPYVRLLRVRGLGHAWSGGASGQAFSDPTGPDALRLAWTFFAAAQEHLAA